MNHRDEPVVQPFFRLCFEKRPAEELYDLRADPYERVNLLEPRPDGTSGSGVDYGKVRKEFSERLEKHLKETGDPRVTGKELPWDTSPPQLP